MQYSSSINTSIVPVLHESHLALLDANLESEDDGGEVGGVLGNGTPGPFLP